MSDTERNRVRAMLVAAGFAVHQVDWMAASCPSIQRCREVCNEQRRLAR